MATLLQDKKRELRFRHGNVAKRVEESPEKLPSTLTTELEGQARWLRQNYHGFAHGAEPFSIPKMGREHIAVQNVKFCITLRLRQPVVGNMQGGASQLATGKSARPGKRTATGRLGRHTGCYGRCIGGRSPVAWSLIIGFAETSHALIRTISFCAQHQSMPRNRTPEHPLKDQERTASADIPTQAKTCLLMLKRAVEFVGLVRMRRSGGAISQRGRLHQGIGFAASMVTRMLGITSGLQIAARRYVASASVIMRADIDRSEGS